MRIIGRLIKRLKLYVPKQIRRSLRFVGASPSLRNSERLAMVALKFRVRRRALTLQDKILYKMAYDRNPLLTTYADKVEVRTYVSERVGSAVLTQVIGVFENISRIERDDLPRNFVLKANHGSGASVICWDGAPRGQVLPQINNRTTWEKFLVHPDELNWNSLVALSNQWLRQNYYLAPGRYPEWAYKNISPKLLAEEVLTHNGDLPEDYKFFMIGGKCKFVQVDIGRFTNHKRNLYSPDWTLSEAIMLFPRYEGELKKPLLFDEMLKIATALSSQTDFIRVDLYETDNGVKFGELTNYPGAGLESIDPSELSIEWAKDWHPIYPLRF